jgi:hypothetical protein
MTFSLTMGVKSLGSLTDQLELTVLPCLLILFLGFKYGNRKDKGSLFLFYLLYSHNPKASYATVHTVETACQLGAL